MRAADLGVLGCPVCHGPLAPPKEGFVFLDAGELRCARDAAAYPIEEGVPMLVRPDRVDRVRAFAEAYSAAWRRDGWGAADPRYLLALPYRDTTGRRRSEWRVKARSLDALLAALPARGRRRIVDLGCGMGWLAHRLAQAGHDVYAVDVLRDDVLGLGAARVYADAGPSFERAWGELDAPPFQPASVDAVVCNASLHYAPSVPDALAAIAAILRPGGILYVMNSPVHRQRRDADRAERDFQARLRSLGAGAEVASVYRHFDRAGLGGMLRERVGPVTEVRFDPGLGFRAVRWLKGIALRMELATFPILAATKPA